MHDIDWASPVYGNLPKTDPLKGLKVIDKAPVMGAAINSSALKARVLAHSAAIGHIDDRGMIPLVDYEAINATLGHMVAPVPKSTVVDVYNAFAAVAKKDVVGSYMKSLVNDADAVAAYKAFWEFKDVVAAAQRWATGASVITPFLSSDFFF